ncbi:MAG: TIGR03905 family TSCPD domain-containing protein [Clostridia bacterium]|nr:TIGR03905 family TSCPD domain-containing protein [Clostridia bacterium]
MRHQMPLSGVCPVSVAFDLDGDKVTNIEFTGGCNGNLKAISKLVDGWSVDEITEALAGNTCGFKQTSCADQLTKALARAQEK